MTARCGWGILGTGKIARIVARALHGSATGRLAAVASRDAARAERFAAGFGAGRPYGSYPALIGDPAVEVVYVATPHPGHRDWAVAAAAAGKHVVCEKPLAVTADGASEIVDTARRNGVFLMEGFAYRCHPQTARLAGLLRAGDIGEVRMIDAVFGYDAGPAPGNYLLSPALAGGSILDVGCYPTSMAHLVAAVMAGRPAVASMRVTGAAHIGDTGVDHYAAAVLTFPGGVVARVASAIALNLGGSARISGTRGAITLPSPWLPGVHGEPSSIIVDRPGSAAREIRVEPGAGLYELEVDAVGRLVREGRPSHPLMSWDDSLANMATLDAWRHAAGHAGGEPGSGP